MARNRKRRNERRPRRPVDEGSGRPGVATARGQRLEPGDRAEPVVPEEVREPTESAEGVGETPGALEHATPDVELAEAHLAIGRAEAGALEPADEDEASTEDDDPDIGSPGAEPPVGAELTSRGQTAPAPRGGTRLVHFLQGSWRELQRVQWPDRRQVMQATGVVLGFVIVAGLFLGAADWAAQKIVNLIIK